MEACAGGCKEIHKREVPFHSVASTVFHPDWMGFSSPEFGVPSYSCADACPSLLPIEIYTGRERPRIIISTVDILCNAMKSVNISTKINFDGTFLFSHAKPFWPDVSICGVSVPPIS